MMATQSVPVRLQQPEKYLLYGVPDANTPEFDRPAARTLRGEHPHNRAHHNDVPGFPGTECGLWQLLFPRRISQPGSRSTPDRSSVLASEGDSFIRSPAHSTLRLRHFSDFLFIVSFHYTNRH